jgi:hypothetical protein
MNQLKKKFWRIVIGWSTTNEVTENIADDASGDDKIDWVLEFYTSRICQHIRVRHMWNLHWRTCAAILNRDSSSMQINELKFDSKWRRALDFVDLRMHGRVELFYFSFHVCEPILYVRRYYLLVRLFVNYLFSRQSCLCAHMNYITWRYQ